MKLNKTMPHVVFKDPEKAATERRARRKSFGQALFFVTGMGLAIWWIKSPDTLKVAFNHLMELLK